MRLKRVESSWPFRSGWEKRLKLFKATFLFWNMILHQGDTGSIYLSDNISVLTYAYLITICMYLHFWIGFSPPLLEISTSCVPPSISLQSSVLPVLLQSSFTQSTNTLLGLPSSLYLQNPDILLVFPKNAIHTSSPKKTKGNFSHN